MKVSLVVLSGAIIIFISGACLLRWRATETWESKGAAFKVRVLKYPERGDPFLPGAYYVFQSAPVSSEEWADIMTFRHDDSVSIPRDQVRLTTENVGYVFMGWNYAVTTNGGATWTLWDANRDLPGWRCCHYKLIEDVRIEVDGSGTMTLNPDARTHGLTKLYTKDHGRRWSAEE